MATTKQPAETKATAKKTTASMSTTTKSATSKKVATPKKEASTKKASGATKAGAISPSERYKMIEVAAYYMAEKDQFSGNVAEYWVMAEREISAKYPK